MDGKTCFKSFFFNLIIFPLAQKVGAGAQKRGGAAALPAPPPPRSLDKVFKYSQSPHISDAIADLRSASCDFIKFPLPPSLIGYPL